MKIFVTGGAGFIGSWVVKVLLDEGHSVTVFDNLSKGHTSAVDRRATLVEGDLASQEAVTKALGGHDAVIHMAGSIEVAESVAKPVFYTENNVVNAVKLLEAMRQVNVKTIIFSSSATVSGTPVTLPITENDPLGIASNPYGASKVSIEFFCQTYFSQHNFNVILLRYFNPYGPGELHEPESHAIPNFIKAALADKQVPLYWQGEQIRDFIYVEDLARAHTAVLEQTGLHVFNVGTEKGIKVKDILTTLSQVIGKEVIVEDLGKRPGDVMATYASSDKLHKATGWQAKIDVTEGLQRTAAFFRQLKITT